MKKILYTIILVNVCVLYSYAQTYKGPSVDKNKLLISVTAVDNVTYKLIANNADGKEQLAIGSGGASSGLVSALRDAITLPVTLSSFFAKKEANTVKVMWSTVSERDFSHFEVLKSTDGKSFRSIGYVAAKGNSNGKIEYQLNDQNPEQGTNYYQLKMVDLDGSSKASSVVSVRFDLNKPDVIVVGNSNDGVVKFEVYSYKSGSFKVDLVDLQGRKVSSNYVNLEKGGNSFNVGISLAPQILVAVIDFGDEKIAKKFYY